MKEKKSIVEQQVTTSSIQYRPIARNDNSPMVDVYEVSEDGLSLVKVNQKDSQAEIDRYATNLDVASIIERYVQSDNPIEINARTGQAINQEIEVEELQQDGSYKTKKIRYADASWVAPNDTYISIQEKLKKASKAINQLNEEIAKAENIKQNDSNKMAVGDGVKSTTENQQQAKQEINS